MNNCVGLAFKKYNQCERNAANFEIIRKARSYPHMASFDFHAEGSDAIANSNTKDTFRNKSSVTNSSASYISLFAYFGQLHCFIVTPEVYIP